MLNQNRNEFYRLARKALRGVTKYQTALVLTHCTAATLEPAITGAESSVRRYNVSRHSKRMAFVTLRSRRAEADKLIEKARNYLTTFLGSEWNESWVQIGFSEPSLALPRTDAQRLGTLLSLTQHFLDNPAQANAAAQLTGDICNVAHTQFKAAVEGVDECRQNQRAKRDARDVAETELTNCLNTLRSELESVMSADDPRWLEFIDRIPGDPRVPEAVDVVHVVAEPGGVVRVDWDDTARADRYKVFKRVMGVDAAPVLVATVEDSQAEIEGLPRGAKVQVQVLAVNGVGESGASPTVELQAA